MKIVKPEIEDLASIKTILSQWTEAKEVKKYISRIENEIKGRSEFNMHFWVAKKQQVVGVIGLSDPLPILKSFFQTSNPLEIKILYVDKIHTRQGIGKALVSFLENKAIEVGCKEIFVRSAIKYKDTAWTFYMKLGYQPLGIITNHKNNKMQVFRKIIK